MNHLPVGEPDHAESASHERDVSAAIPLERLIVGVVRPPVDLDHEIAADEEVHPPDPGDRHLWARPHSKTSKAEPHEALDPGLAPRIDSIEDRRVPSRRLGAEDHPELLTGQQAETKCAVECRDQLVRRQAAPGVHESLEHGMQGGIDTRRTPHVDPRPQGHLEPRGTGRDGDVQPRIRRSPDSAHAKG